MDTFALTLAPAPGTTTGASALLPAALVTDSADRAGCAWYAVDPAAYHPPGHHPHGRSHHHHAA